jgi:putative DNA primase/helicase
MFNTDGMHEALKGFDFKRALDVLVESGALPKPGSDGKKAKPERAGGRVTKLYAISPSKLGGDHES